MNAPDSSSSDWKTCPPGLLRDTGRSARARITRRRALMQLGLASGAVVVGGLLWKRSQDHGVAGTAPVVPTPAPNVEPAPVAPLVDAAAPMECDDVVRMLPSYLAGTLPTGERERIDRHLRTCEHCTQDLARLRARRNA